MFELHQILANDTVMVTDWPLCRILLMNDSTFPWLIMVPRRHGIQEIHELSADDRHALTEEIAMVAQRLQNMTGAAKMNVAALGNVVHQLHVHVIARGPGDPAWPKPIWGQCPPKPYAPGQLEHQLTALRAVLQPLRSSSCC